MTTPSPLGANHLENGPNILGIIFGGHDTSAALMVNGEVIAACEQERYSLDKHSRRFPSDAINDCLRLGGLQMRNIDEIAFGIDPIYYIRETYLRSALDDDARIGFMLKDIERIQRLYHMEKRIREQTQFEGPITFHLHHLCHVASAYYPSGFDHALVVSLDGMGEIDTGMIATGRGGELQVQHNTVRYPHSLGLLYSALTFFLGFQHHCDEGIIMGLAPYGNPHATIPGQSITYYEAFAQILVETGDFTYEVSTDWMDYYQVRNKWVSDRFIQLFGPKRDYSEPITNHHKDIAAALQARMEDVVIGILRRARDRWKMDKLCLAGGVALNCSMNGKIERSGIFDEIFVQPASGDSGISLGACFLAHKARTGHVAIRPRHDSYLGSGWSNTETLTATQNSAFEFHQPEDLTDWVARQLAEGRIVGWFQGRSEFGPRALGNRSILTRPFPAEMKDILNARVKFREEFRPFAPAVLERRTQEFFEIDQASPHMLIACQARPEVIDQIPAVVHVDGSCRVQTIRPTLNPRFHSLVEAFERHTGVPVVLNTSFNVKGQPIVNTPQQAIDCFAATNIDVLVLGDWVTQKQPPANESKPNS